MININNQKGIKGKVESKCNENTVAILLERTVKHKPYGKYIKKTNKLLAHDEFNICNIGDYVIIAEARPISKRKKHKVVTVLKEQ